MSATPNAASRISPEDDPAFQVSNSTEFKNNSEDDFEEIDKAFFEAAKQKNLDSELSGEKTEIDPEKKGIIEYGKKIFGFAENEADKETESLDKIENGEVSSELKAPLTDTEAKKTAELKKRVYGALAKMKTIKLTGNPVEQDDQLYDIYNTLERDGKNNLSPEVEKIYKKLAKTKGAFYSGGKYNVLTEDENFMLAEAEGRNLSDDDIRAMISGDKPWHIGGYMRAKRMLENQTKGVGQGRADNDNNDSSGFIKGAAIGAGAAAGIGGLVAMRGNLLAGANPDKDRVMPDQSIEINHEQILEDLKKKQEKLKTQIEKLDFEINNNPVESAYLASLKNATDVNEKISVLQGELKLISKYSQLTDPDAKDGDTEEYYLSLIETELKNTDEIKDENERLKAKLDLLEEKHAFALNGVTKKRNLLLQEKSDAESEIKNVRTEILNTEANIIKSKNPEQAKVVDELTKRLTELKESLPNTKVEDYKKVSDEILTVNGELMKAWDKLQVPTTPKEEAIESVESFKDPRPEIIRKELQDLEDIQTQILASGIETLTPIEKLRIRRIDKTISFWREKLKDIETSVYESPTADADQEKTRERAFAKQEDWTRGQINPFTIERTILKFGQDTALTQTKEHLENFKGLTDAEQFEKVVKDWDLDKFEAQSYKTPELKTEAVVQYVEVLEQVISEINVRETIPYGDELIAQEAQKLAVERTVDSGFGKFDVKANETSTKQENKERTEMIIKEIESQLIAKINTADSISALENFVDLPDQNEMDSVLIKEGVDAKKLEQIPKISILDIYYNLLDAADIQREKILSRSESTNTTKIPPDAPSTSSIEQIENEREKQSEIVMNKAHELINGLDSVLEKIGRERLEHSLTALRSARGATKIGAELRSRIKLNEQETNVLNDDDAEILRDELVDKVIVSIEKKKQENETERLNIVSAAMDSARILINVKKIELERATLDDLQDRLTNLDAVTDTSALREKLTEGEYLLPDQANRLGKNELEELKNLLISDTLDLIDKKTKSTNPEINEQREQLKNILEKLGEQVDEISIKNTELIRERISNPNYQKGEIATEWNKLIAQAQEPMDRAELINFLIGDKVSKSDLENLTRQELLEKKQDIIYNLRQEMDLAKTLEQTQTTN